MHPLHDDLAMEEGTTNQEEDAPTSEAPQEIEKPLTKSQLKKQRALERKQDLKVTRLKTMVRRDARRIAKIYSETGEVDMNEVKKASARQAEVAKSYNVNDELKSVVSDEPKAHWGELHLTSVEMFETLNTHRKTVIQGFMLKSRLKDANLLETQSEFLNLLDVHARDVEELANKWQAMATKLDRFEGPTTLDNHHLFLDYSIGQLELYEEIGLVLADRFIKLGSIMIDVADELAKHEAESSDPEAEKKTEQPTEEVKGESNEQ